MIMGDRGTGKSTTIRALADLLPDITIIKNDPSIQIQRFGKITKQKK
jgi:Mg-chelatase subunit ChlI